MPIFDIQRGALRRDISRGFNDLIATSGSLASPSLNGFLSPVLIFGHASDIIGSELSFYSGGGASLAEGTRVVNAASPYAAGGSMGDIRVRQVWGAAPSTNSGWEMHRLFNRQQYDDAISHAIRRVSKKILLPAHEYLVVNSWLLNPLMSTWLGGDSAAPTGWALTGTGAAASRITTDQWESGHAARVANGASEEAYLAQTMLDVGKFAGQTVNITALCRTVTADRARVRLNDSSAGVLTQSSFHAGTSNGDGSGTWRELTISNYAIPSTAQDVSIQLYTATGAAINVDWGSVLVDIGDRWTYPLTQRFAYIQDVLVSTEAGRWTPLPREWWFVDKAFSAAGTQAALSRIGLLQQFFSPSAGDLLRVVGQQYPTDPAEGDNLPVDPEYVRARVVADLYAQRPWGAADWQGDASKARVAEDNALRLERMMATRIAQGSRVVEEV